MAVSGLVRLCCIGSDKGGIAALAREDSPTGAALRELEVFPPREGAGPQEEVARKCLLASGLVALRETTRLMTPQPGSGTPPALEEQLPEDVVPRKFFARGYQYEIFSWLRRRGRRLPAVLLPEAVRWAAAGGHEVIRPVLGRAGEQLCRDNPAWRPLLADGAGAAAEQTGGVDLSLWDEASPEVRCRLLQSLRARDPQAGRELAAPLLRRAFSKNRLLLYALRQGLSAEDIPLLEECSRKKFAAVGLHPARLLLSLLPESKVSREPDAGDILIWKEGKPSLKEDIPDGWRVGRGAGILQPDHFLTTLSLDWWLARSGGDCGELLPVLVRGGFLLPVAMRIFLEDRKDWLRLLLEHLCTEALTMSGARPGLGFLGVLAAAMLPREDIERLLRLLLEQASPHDGGCDRLAVAMLLYAGFEPSRDIWSLYIEALRRRTEDCLRWRVMRKVARLDPAWREVFSALWNPELDECTPESFQRWTCRRFRDSHGMTPVLYHVAWEMPLDLLERLIQTLQLPPAVFLFEDEQTVLDAIERFRAMPVLDAISEFCAMPLRLQDRLVQTWQQSSDASRFQDEQRELDAIRRFRVRAEHAC